MTNLLFPVLRHFFPTMRLSVLEDRLILQSKSRTTEMPYQVNMKKNLMTLAVLLYSTMAMAQLNSANSWKYSDSIPRLQPLKVSFECSLCHHSQPNLIHASLVSMQYKDTDDTLSIMFRHKETYKPLQFHYRYSPDYTKMVDNFRGVRDRIVRKRRWEEGRPLQPLTPPSRFGRW